MATSSSKHVDLPLSLKVKLLDKLELPGVTQTSMAKKFNVLTSQVLHLVVNLKGINQLTHKRDNMTG